MSVLVESRGSIPPRRSRRSRQEMGNCRLGRNPFEERSARWSIRVEPSLGKRALRARLRAHRRSLYRFPGDSFKSPLAGTVDTTRTGPGRNGLSSAFNCAAQSTQSRTAAINGINRRLNFISLAKNSETVTGFLRTKSRFMESPFCMTAARGKHSADPFWGRCRELER
jgi:hypothetical protein